MLPSSASATTVDADQFGALCNLFHALACDKADLTTAQIGDIVYFHGYPVVCDESRTLARAVMALLGLRFAEYQPRHEPGSGCRFADELGNCEFHDNRFANTLVDEVKAAMLNGQGSLAVAEDADL
jgi:hypothetical protein